MKKNNAITKILLKTFLMMVFWFISSITVNAQTNKPENEPFDSPTAPITCEMWILYLGTTLQEWEKQWKKNNDTSLIVIARPGDKELRQTNLIRIKTLKEYILAPRWKVKAVFAEGDRIKGFGVIELYVEGKLFYSLPLHKKEDIPLRFCY